MQGTIFVSTCASIYHNSTCKYTLVCVVTYAPLSLFDSHVLVCASSVTDVACCGCCWKFCMRKKEAELDLVLLVWS